MATYLTTLAPAWFTSFIIQTTNCCITSTRLLPELCVCSYELEELFASTWDVESAKTSKAGDFKNLWRERFSSLHAFCFALQVIPREGRQIYKEWVRPRPWLHAIFPPQFISIANRCRPLRPVTAQWDINLQFRSTHWIRIMDDSSFQIHFDWTGGFECEFPSYFWMKTTA